MSVNPRVEDRIYMDYNATTPVDSTVIAAISRAFKDTWGNASTSYATDVVFTSGGTESNNVVIHSAITEFVERMRDHGPGILSGSIPHVITTNIEHDSIKLPLEHLSNKNMIECTFVPVCPESGCVQVESVLSAVKPNTCLVTVMLANNETGIVQPVAKIAQEIRKVNQARRHDQKVACYVWVHTDAAQAIGKIPVHVSELAIDFLTIVGHKFYGPRIGALYCNQSGFTAPRIHPMLFGGNQEFSLRPGTENTPLIVGLGKACQLVSSHLVEFQSHMKTICESLKKELKAAFGNAIHFNGQRKGGVECLPNTCSIAFHNCSLTGAEILEKAQLIEASVGAACHKASLSSVLTASGIPEHLAQTTIRLSVGRETTYDDIHQVVKALKNVLRPSENASVQT